MQTLKGSSFSTKPSKIILDRGNYSTSVEVMKDRQLHAKERLFERYGVIANDEYLDGIIERILTGKIKSSKKANEGNIRINIKFRKRLFNLVFNPMERLIVTFLSPTIVMRGKPRKNIKLSSKPYSNWA